MPTPQRHRLVTMLSGTLPPLLTLLVTLGAVTARWPRPVAPAQGRPCTSLIARRQEAHSPTSSSRSENHFDNRQATVGQPED